MRCTQDSREINTGIPFRKQTQSRNGNFLVHFDPCDFHVPKLTIRSYIPLLSSLRNSRMNWQKDSRKYSGNKLVKRRVTLHFDYILAFTCRLGIFHLIKRRFQVYFTLLSCLNACSVAEWACVFTFVHTVHRSHAPIPLTFLTSDTKMV